MAAVRHLRDYTTTTLLVLMFVLFSAASFRTEAQQQDQDQIAAKQTVALATIKANTARIEALVVSECAARAVTSKDTNQILDALIEGTVAWGPKASTDRLNLWRSAKVPPVTCP